MYSVVLMAALTAGTSTPAWGWGCHGCWGGRLGCHGCWGGRSSCSGSCYGCYGGYGCNGWYNGCYGCSGGACFGGYGFGCYGSGSYASGCYGSGSYASYGSGWYFGASCYGTSCAGCYGGAICAPAAPAGGQAAPPGGTAPEQVPAPKKEESKTTSLDHARLIVTLPVDAKLYVDDRPTKATSKRRVFNSPRLDEGQTYYYILRAEVVRDGKTQSETKRVLLQGGDVIEASFLDLGSLVPVGADASARR